MGIFEYPWLKKNSGCTDGVAAICKKCDSKRASIRNILHRKARSEYEKIWRALNKDKTDAYVPRQMDWAKKHPDRMKATRRKYLSSEKGKTVTAQYTSLYNSVYREEKNKHKLQWMKVNKGRVNAATSAYQKRIKQATPLWASREDILNVYEEAAYMGMEVDHIVPIRGKTVCGLHTWENLQIIPRLDNIKKGNRFWEDMPA